MEEIGSLASAELEICRRLHNFWLHSFVPDSGIGRESTRYGETYIHRKVGTIALLHELSMDLREGILPDETGELEIKRIGNVELRLAGRQNGMITESVGGLLTSDLHRVLAAGRNLDIDDPFEAAFVSNPDGLQRIYGKDRETFLPLILEGLVEHHDDVTNNPPSQRLHISLISD